MKQEVWAREQIVTNLFGAAKMERMQPDKTSKKTRKNASQPASTASAEKGTAAEKTAASRSSKSSLSKNEPVETSSAKRHRKAGTMNVPEAVVEQPILAPKAMAAAAGSLSLAMPVTSSVEVEVGPVESRSSLPMSQERIQELAYEYWLAEGKRHGSHHEHWRRAERELGLAK